MAQHHADHTSHSLATHTHYPLHPSPLQHTPCKACAARHTMADGARSCGPLAALMLVVLVACAPAATRAQDAHNITGESAAPAAADNSSATAAAPPQLTVDVVTPPFVGIRACLPFNVLVAAPQEMVAAARGGSEGGAAPGGGVAAGRIMMTAAADVINSTHAFIENGILTLSLTGTGFYSDQPINLTVTVPPSGGNFTSVANYGPGLVVVGPGLRTDVLRVYAPTVGQVRAINVTATTLSFTGSGVLGSFFQGAFTNVSITTGAATGNVGVTSVTPVNLEVALGGIFAVAVEAPAGTVIRGTAGGLSKVQYTLGTCNIRSQAAPGFSATSLLAGFGGNLFTKCERVPAVTSFTANPTSIPDWTCGVAVDGKLSCQGASTSSANLIALSNAAGAPPAATGAPLPGPAGPASGGDFVNTTTPEATTSAPATTPAANAQPTNGAGTNAGAPAGATVTSPAANAAVPAAPGAGTNTPTASNIPGANTATPNAPNGGTTTTADVPAGNTAPNGGTTADVPTSGGDAAGSNAGTGATASLQVIESGAAGGGGGAPTAPTAPTAPAAPAAPAGSSGRRRQVLRRLQQAGFFPVTTAVPGGSLTTGSFTSGPRSFASGTSSVSGPSGTSSQTTTSAGGAPATTTFSNPVFVADQPASSFSTSGPSSPPPSPSPSPSPSPEATAASAPLPSSVSISTSGAGGSGGVAVVNTQCATNGSLSMLQA